MLNKILSPLLVVMLAGGNAFAAAKIQNEDVKSLSQVQAAGGTAANLINDTKLYSTQYSMQLSQAISSGLIGGSAAPGNLLKNASFETGSIATNWTLGSGTALSGGTSPNQGVDTTNFIDGNQSVALTLTSVAAGATVISQTLTPASQIAGQYLDFNGYVKTTISGLQLCGILAGVQVDCRPVTADGIWHNYTPHGTYASGTLGVALVNASASTATGTLNFDGAFAGRSTGLLGVTSISDWQPYTPTITGIGTPTGLTAYWRQVGDSIEVLTTVTTGTVSASLMTETLPNGFVLNASKIGAPGNINNNTTEVGKGSRGTGGSAANTIAVLAIPATSTSLVYFGFNGSPSNNPLSNQNGNGVFTSGDAATWRFTVPILGLSSSASAVRADQTNFGWMPYTPTFTGFGTVTSPLVYYKRNGQNLEVRGTVTTGTVAAATASVTLPAGLALDLTAGVPTNTTTGAGLYIGEANANGGGNQQVDMVTAAGTSTSIVYFGGVPSGTGALIPSNGSTFAGSSQTLSFKFTVPIAGWTETQKAPVLVGGVTSKYAKSAYVQWFKSGTSVCSTTPCPSVSTSGDLTVTRTGTGAYTLTSSTTCAPLMICSWNGANTSNGTAFSRNIANDTSTVETAGFFSAGTTTAIDVALDIQCTCPQ